MVKWYISEWLGEINEFRDIYNKRKTILWETQVKYWTRS